MCNILSNILKEVTGLDLWVDGLWPHGPVIYLSRYTKNIPEQYKWTQNVLCDKKIPSRHMRKMCSTKGKGEKEWASSQDQNEIQ